jgi:hypothetical protein
MSGSDFTAYAGGLVGQMTGTGTDDRPNIFNAYGGLNLSVNIDPKGDNGLFVGGITGGIGSPTAGAAVKLRDLSAVGNITVGRQSSRVNTHTTADTYFGLFVGGLAGFMRGTNTLNRAELINSDYRQGDITVWSGDGVTNIGGAVGRVNNFANIIESSSIAGNFNINKSAGNSHFFAGGFLGDFGRGSTSTGTVRDCFSSNPVVINTEPGYTGHVTAGGFAGRSSTFISHCYALGDVSVTGYGNLYVGGFLGIGFTAVDVRFSYSTGNVSVYSRGGGETYAGGFSGTSRGVSDSYALGDVFVEMTTTTGGSGIQAGAFAGEFASGNYTVERNFALGSVNAQRITNGIINAGGFVGRFDTAPTRPTGNFRNNAALGLEVRASGGTIRNVGRFYGSMLTGPILDNNRAFNGMRLYQSAFFGDGRPAEIIVAPLVLTGTPVLSGTTTNATVTIQNWNVEHTNAPVYVSTSMTVTLSATTSPAADARGTWNESTRTITNIDLSGQGHQSNNHTFHLTLQDNAGGSNTYTIRIHSPVNRENFLISSLDELHISALDSQHGREAHQGNFRNFSFWMTDMNFSEGWDFSWVGVRGRPRLLNSEGGIMGGQ